VNAGGGLGRDRSQLSIPAAGASETSYLQPQGGLGGAQIGYNWQTNSVFGPLVYGIEADIQGAGLKDGYTCLFACGAIPQMQFNQKLDWFGTVRGRLGLATGPVLSYVTGGYAYGNVSTSVTETLVGLPPTTFNASSGKSGWTLGSGVEAALGGNWTGKIEYLYVNLGNRTDAFAIGGFPQTLSTELRENIFRAGLNYRFGGNATYTPLATANWTGLYLGGNLGSGTARNQSSLALLPFNENFTLAPDGIIGGGQIGYNWQAANWVFGIEGDFQGSTQKDNKTCVALCGPLPGSFAAFNAKLPWLATARGRLGYSIGSTLVYATGGYAYGDVKTEVGYNLGGGPLATTLDKKQGGWTVGGGIETPFTFLGWFGPNWTSKTEYLYVDLGSSNYSIPTGFGGGTATFTTGVKEQIFRTGLNYHFSSPVVAKY
jgi:outer membrane immunogenic protein